MDLDKAVSRGNRAEELMNDPLMVEAAAHIDAELWRLFQSAVPTDIESLAQIKSMQYMHGKYAAFLKKCIQDGKMARMDIERRKKSLKERFLG
jgi:hypothetical protein